MESEENNIYYYLLMNTEEGTKSPHVQLTGNDRVVPPDGRFRDHVIPVKFTPTLLISVTFVSTIPQQ